MKSEEIINFFSGLLGQEIEVEETKAGIKEDLKSYAENNEIEPKALADAYNLFKRFKKGKNSKKVCSDYSELSTIVENYFTLCDEACGE